MNECHPQSLMVPKGTPFEYFSGKVCSPVASTVKAKLPLPTVSEAKESIAVTCGLCRVTTALRSMFVCAIIPEYRHKVTAKRKIRLIKCFSIGKELPENVSTKLMQAGAMQVCSFVVEYSLTFANV